MKKLFLPVILGTAVLLAAGCKEKSTGEKMGEALDNAAKKTEDGAKKAADSTGDALKNAGDKVKETAK